MSKYEVKLPGKNVTNLSIDEPWKAVYSGKEFDYDAKFISENVLLIRIGGRNHMIRLEDSEGVIMKLVSEAVRYSVTCKNELDLIKEKYIGTENNRFKDKIISPMPGAVVKINIKEGDVLKEGDVMIVLEAMKMENEIKAESNCVVKNLHVDEKVSVDKGQLLITLSESASE